MYRRHWIRIAGPFLLFVIAGTMGLIFLQNSALQPMPPFESAEAAKASPDLISDPAWIDDEEDGEGYMPDSRAVLGRDSQMAPNQDLSRQNSIEQPDRRWAAPEARAFFAADVHAGSEGPSLRHANPILGAALSQPLTLCALAIFWALCLFLACALVLPYLKDRRFALIGSLGTSLAHEIRNPIAAIRLHGQLLEQTQPLAAGLIAREAARIEDMLNQWLYLARPEPPRKTERALSDLLDTTLQALGPTAAHARVRVVVTPLTRRHVQVDAHRFGQVFHNVILNAIQAMPKGGTLYITVSEQDISFADNGPGFSRKALRRGGEMLYSEKEGGMGLGLKVARNIVRAHGGRLTFGNRPEGGALVRIQI